MITQTHRQTNEEKRKLALDALTLLKSIDDSGERIEMVRMLCEQLASDFFHNMMKSRYADMAITMNSFRDEESSE